MTPSQIELSARRRYNAVNDTFWSQAEMFDMIFHAQMEMASESLVIQNKYSTPTVANQQAYAYPSRAISIKRITYDGAKIDPIDMREDDAISLSNTTSIATGTPQYYYVWEGAIYLQPVPAEAKTLAIWTYDVPETVVATSDIDVPQQYQPSIVYFLLAEMAMKDGNLVLSDRYRSMWEAAKIKAKKLEATKKRADSPTRIKDIDTLAQSAFGTV